ncbi:MAG: hypothetical protein KDI12_20645 [Anaerolineae bacterium]|nr:hypothetical protein [Anaerolineae bacterium]MCB1566534.1 hypothetical protein [Xanthomonadales bacterium]
MELLGLEHFSGCLNETFETEIDGMAMRFTLVEAQPLPSGNPQRKRDPFSLLFLNEAAVVFPQKVYSLRHPRLGTTGIFLVPIARNRDGFIYQAVFN